MKSKFTEAFDSLASDERIRRERTERILSEYHADAAASQSALPESETIAKKRIFSGKRGIALLTAIFVFIAAAAIAVPVGISIHDGGGLLRAMSLLKDTYVDMDGVSAFGVWTASDSAAKSAYLSNVMRVSVLSDDTDDGNTDDVDTDGDDPAGGDDALTDDWSDDERYDWESDYDWDPANANVLVAIGEDGSITEVVYERTNGRGQVRQDVLGNAAKVFVSNGFTYVMYVSDEEWEFWTQIEYAQQMRSPNGFSCHHETMQTVVIHNATGKVFALNDIFPQVNELSGAVNRTLQADPFKDDFLRIQPLYGNEIPQWYNVCFDEDTEELRYELVVPEEALSCNVRAVRRDRYGQQFILAGASFGTERVSAGIVDLPDYAVYGNTLIFTEQNGLLYGTDGRVYAFDNGTLKVFGDRFELEPVSPADEVAFEGIADAFGGKLIFGNDGINYTLKDGYLFSMFGEVWEIGGDGGMSSRDRLEGSFPRYADDGYLIGGEVIAFVDTSLVTAGACTYSANGRMVQIAFGGSAEGSPSVSFVPIISASEISCNGTRMLIEQNENPYSDSRGETKYFLLTVTDGKPVVEYVAYGNNGGVSGLVNPITEPLVQS